MRSLVVGLALLLVLLVAGMMSATLLDFEPGAWIAAGALLALVLARTLGWFGVLPDALDLGDDD